jgi:hypothetical protein
MISINLSSIEKLASAMLRQIHPRVSNFDRNHAVAPIRNRYILAVATPVREPPAHQVWNLVGALHRIFIGRLKQFCRIATSCEQQTSIERRMKSAALTLNVSVQCFENSGKLGWA